MAGVLNQLLPMIKSSSQRTSDDLNPEELLILLIYIYSVPGDVTLDRDLGEVEEKVKKALAHVLSEESELSPLLQKITGECGTNPADTWGSVSHLQDLPVFPIGSFSRSCNGWSAKCLSGS